MDEIAFLTSTVRRLETEIDRLNNQRAAFLRRLNEITPATRVLPPETLALVFHHASEHVPLTLELFPNKKPPRVSPVLLGAVCSHWRQVAWSTPALWTYIDPVPIRRNAQHSDASLLRLYFTNARALPVAIQIKLDRLSSSPSTASEDILRAVFTENSRNIRILMCTSKSSLRQRWAMLVPKLAQAHFENLERLEINLRGAPLSRYDTAMFVNAPKLSRVTFAGYHLTHETFWEQITVLDLSSLPINQCLETLIRCSNLVDFRVSTPRQSNKSVELAMHTLSAVTLEHLEKFEWVGALAEWDVFLYTHVRLPNLRHLALGNSQPLSRVLTDGDDPTSDAHEPRTTDPELWKTFFRHVKNLAVLECTVFHSTQEWLDIFDIFSTIHTLRFTAFRDADETLRLLRALQITALADGGGGSSSSSNADPMGGGGVPEAPKNYLPNLKVLSATLDLHPDRSKQVLDILCSRRLRPMLPVPPPPPPLPPSPSPPLLPPLPQIHPWGATMTAAAITTIPPTTTTTPSDASSTSSESSSSSIISTVMDTQPNDWLINPNPDITYWNTHTRLEEAAIKCWPFGYEFGEREKEIAKVLKESGLKLEVFGQSTLVDWL